MNKPLTWTLHAIGRAATAGVDWQAVEAAITQPDRVDPAGGGRRVYTRRYTDPASAKLRLVRVVVEETGSEMVIVTVYVTSKVAKYLGT